VGFEGCGAGADEAATMGFQRALDLWVWGFLGFRLKPESALNGFVE